MVRDVKLIKKFILNRMKNDTTLTNLVSASNIYQDFPLDNTTYPMIYYRIVDDEPYPFNESDRSSNTTETIFSLEIDSEKDSTSEIDSIENRLFQLFNGISYSDENILVWSCERSFYFSDRDEGAKLRKCVTQYTMRSSPK